MTRHLTPVLPCCLTGPGTMAIGPPCFNSRIKSRVVPACLKGRAERGGKGGGFAGAVCDKKQLPRTVLWPVLPAGDLSGERVWDQPSHALLEW